MSSVPVVKHGQRWVLSPSSFEVKLAQVDEEVGWQPAVIFTVAQPDGPDVELVWPLEVPDALYLASTLRSDAREVAKQQKKLAEFVAAEAMAKEYEPQLRTPTGCVSCSRPVAVISEDGTRYCKRHAEEAGVRPHGKIA